LQSRVTCQRGHTPAIDETAPAVLQQLTTTTLMMVWTVIHVPCVRLTRRPDESGHSGVSLALKPRTQNAGSLTQLTPRGPARDAPRDDSLSIDFVFAFRRARRLPRCRCDDDLNTLAVLPQSQIDRLS